MINLSENLLSEEKKQLLQLYALDDLSQEKLDSVISRLDIETFRSRLALSFAYLTKKFPDLDFGAYNFPRLKGLLRFHRFKNLETLDSFSRIIKKMNSLNMIPMLINDAAMKCLRPDLPRIMGRLDVLTADDSDLDLFHSILTEQGYDAAGDNQSLYVRPAQCREETVLGIHKNLDFLDYNGDVRCFFDRAALVEVYGLRCCLPINENLAFMLMIHLFKVLQQMSNVDEALLFIIDLIYLSKTAGFEWERVRKNIISNVLENEFCFSGMFVNSIVPDVIPQFVLKCAD